LRDAGNPKFSDAPVSKLFQEQFIAANSLDEKGFAEWVFHPAMLFGSKLKWWGSLEERDTPHEGLDLFYYRTTKGDFGYLDEKILVPVMFNGRVAKIVDDFLGRSVFVSHDSFDNGGHRLYTIYGHLIPYGTIHMGSILNEADILGTLAAAQKSNRAAPSHLHISAAWISKTVSSSELDWQLTGDPTKVALLDPLLLFQCPYSIVETIQPFGG